MNRTIAFLIFILLSVSIPSHAKEINYTVNKIWANSEYNSFTSLVKYRNKFYCAFREGKGHVFDADGKAEGKIRIITSSNGKKWKSICLLGAEGQDFRDPQLSITPSGELMVSIGVSIYKDRKLVTHIPHVSYSRDGINFTAAQACTLEGQNEHLSDWIWRTTWQEGTGYTVNYFRYKDGKNGLWLMSTRDGLNYKKIHEFNISDIPTEATIRFLPDGQMGLMLRRDGKNNNGLWGTCPAPYKDWHFKDIPFRLGGPDFVVLNDTCIIAGTRSHLNPRWCTTSVFKGNLRSGTFQHILVLPSGGDTSYPGMILDGKYLWMSYYSAHESRRPDIYLAKIPLKTLLAF